MSLTRRKHGSDQTKLGCLSNGAMISQLVITHIYINNNDRGCQQEDPQLSAAISTASAFAQAAQATCEPGCSVEATFWFLQGELKPLQALSPGQLVPITHWRSRCSAAICLLTGERRLVFRDLHPGCAGNTQGSVHLGSCQVNTTLVYRRRGLKNGSDKQLEGSSLRTKGRVWVIFPLKCTIRLQEGY